VDIPDIQTQIGKIHNHILIFQSEASDTERIIRLEDKKQNIHKEGDITAISITF
jgi:hypothetical protein